MEIVLRNKLTGMYFEGVDDWTRLLEKAFNFQTPERVIRFIRAALLDAAQFEMVFAFSNPRYNFALPIDERFEINTSSVLGRLADPGRTERHNEL